MDLYKYSNKFFVKNCNGEENFYELNFISENKKTRSAFLGKTGSKRREESLIKDAFKFLIARMHFFHGRIYL